MKETDPFAQALAQLDKLDSQLEQGRITKHERDTQRLVVLFDLVIAKGEK